MTRNTYSLQCQGRDGRMIPFMKECSRQFGEGYLRASESQAPRPCLQLVRSDGVVVDTLPEALDVFVGQVAGFPTAEQYEAAANRALAKAKAIREGRTSRGDRMGGHGE